MSLVAIQAIVDVPEGTTPTFPYLKSIARHIKNAQAELAALEAGSEPGFAASIDLRWFAEDVGPKNALEIVPTQEPATGNDLVTGMFYDVLINATNDQSAVTLEVRNTADDVNIVNNVKKQDGSALAVGDLVAGQIERFVYVTDGGSLDEWRVLLLRDMINPMTTAGDIIFGGASGAPTRLAKGATGRHMRAGASGPEYGGAVNMNGDELRGHGGAIVTISAAADLNAGTHRGANLVVNNATLTIKTQATVTYSAGQQCIVSTTDASGCTVTADAGVTINGVGGGSVTINQYEGFGLLRTASDTWLMPNASAS